MAFVYHGTPLTPRSALLALAGRSFCVSFYRADCVGDVEAIAPRIMYDNGAFSFWMRALRTGVDPADAGRADWGDYYAWLDQRIWAPGRWAIIPDMPAAPSQLSDGLINEWPHGRARGAPVWHMDGPIARLGRLCERFDRVCLGWIGDPKREPVGCDAYHRRMDEVDALLGNRWPVLHMLRGVSVGGMYPFDSVDSTSLAQNGWRYDWLDRQDPLFTTPIPNGRAATPMPITWKGWHRGTARRGSRISTPSAGGAWHELESSAA